MTEKVETGHYRLGEIDGQSRRDPPRDIGVIKGSTANDSRRGGFHRILGLAQSKWYVYEESEELRQYYDGSGTGVIMVVSLVEECSSKSTAVKRAEQKYTL